MYRHNRLTIGLTIRAMFVLGALIALTFAALKPARADTFDNDRIEMLRFQTGDRHYGEHAKRAEVQTGKNKVRGADRQQVADLLKAEARRQGIKERLMGTVVAIGVVESGLRCSAVGPRTKYGQALGPVQILYKSAVKLGFQGPPERLNSCGDGITYGIAHMVKCIDAGFDEPNTLARCHVGGWETQVFSRYANAYVSMVAGRI